MLTMILTATLGCLVALGLGFGGVFGVVGSVICGILTFFAANMVVGFILQKHVKAAMQKVQDVLMTGQKHLQSKVQRLQMKISGPGAQQSIQTEILRDQRKMVMDALLLTGPLHRFERWVPMMGRQIATAQFQLYWMIREFAKVDELMPKVLFIDPAMSAMKMARMYMLDKPSKEIGEVYNKAAKRLQYNKNVLLAATYSWILVQRKEVDAAFQVLNQALQKSDNQVLKSNRDQLANNRVAHFNNSGLGDMWYALFLEQPKMHQPRQRMQWK